MAPKVHFLQQEWPRERFSVETFFTHETARAIRMQLLSWLCTPWETGLHLQINLLRFVFCIYQSTSPREDSSTSVPMSLPLCLPKSWVWNRRRDVHTGVFQQSLGRLDNDVRVQEFLLNAWCRSRNNYCAYECFQAVLWAQKVLSTRITHPSFCSTTMSLSSLNVKPFSALLKILSLCTKAAYMKGWCALKRKASKLSVLIDYSKEAFCRELLNFLNGLAVAGLISFCVFSCMNRQASRVYCAHFNLDVWTQQMVAF